MDDKADQRADKASEQDQSLALVPVREQVVDFYGDPIPVGQTPDGELYISLRSLTDSERQLLIVR